VLDYFEQLVQWLSDGYQVLLKWSLKHRVATLIIALLTFFGGLALPASGLIGSEFVPQADYSETGVTFYTPVGSSLELTETKVHQVEGVLRQFPEIVDTYSTVNTGNSQGKNYATVFIRLKPRHQRKMSTSELAPQLRAKLQQVAGITVTQVGSLDGVGGDSKQVRFSLLGPDLDQLARLSAEVQARMRKIPGVVDLDSSLKAQKPTISIEPKRDIGSDLGIGVAQIGGALRPLLAGEAASSWRAPDDENYDVNVRLAPSDRNTTEDLSRLMLASTITNSDGTPRMVPLRQVADIKATIGANQINRRDLNREVELSANAAGRSAGQINADIRVMLDSINWPPGYRYQIGGSTKSMNESFGYALGALGLAIVFIYMILASQFASFLQPIAIMSSLPLTLIGVFLALMFSAPRSTCFHHRFHHVDGTGDQECDSAGGLCQSGPQGRHGARCGAAGSSTCALAADLDDHAGDGVRDGAAGVRRRRRFGTARTNGTSGDRRHYHLVVADAGRGAGGLYLSG